MHGHSRARSARRSAAAWRRRSAASRAWSRPRGPTRRRGARSTSTSAAARCGRGGASTPCWRPTGSARAWRGGASPRPASAPGSPRTRSTPWRRRFLRTSTSCPPTRSRATRASRPPRRGRSSAAGSAWRRSWSRRRLPRSLAALVVDADDSGDQADRLALRLGPEVLVAHVAPFIVALVPAGGRRSELEAAVRGRTAALGPALTWQEAGVSFSRARELLRLARDGGIEEGDGLLLADTHNLALLLGVDRRLARDVADSALAPLDAETELSRERLGSTLDAWLRHRGRTEAVAKALHVHPQTVRYRLARLRELFGSRLDDPDGRFELELALRARRIAG